MDEHALTPVRASISAISARSVSNPSQPEDVPFQQMDCTCASAKSSAAASMGSLVNWLRASSSIDIFSTRNRAKCAEASGKSASIAAVRGSSTVLDDGVSMPKRVLANCAVMRDTSSDETCFADQSEQFGANDCGDAAHRHEAPAGCAGLDKCRRAEDDYRSRGIGAGRRVHR